MEGGDFMTENSEGKQIPPPLTINRAGSRDPVIGEELIPREPGINEAGHVERPESFVDAMQGYGPELVDYIGDLNKAVARNPELKQNSTMQEAGALLHLTAM